MVEATEEVEGTELGLDEAGVAGPLHGRPATHCRGPCPGAAGSSPARVVWSSTARLVRSLRSASSNASSAMVRASSTCRLPSVSAWTNSARASSLGGPSRSSSTASAAISRGDSGVSVSSRRRGERREELAAVDVGGVGRHRGEPGPQHLHRLGHAPGCHERLGAAAYEGECVDVGHRRCGRCRSSSRASRKWVAASDGPPTARASSPASIEARMATGRSSAGGRAGPARRRCRSRRPSPSADDEVGVEP